MKKETFVIKTIEDTVSCTAWIKELFALHGSLEVIVSTETRTRSVLQNSLYWLWVTQISTHLGLLKDETHEMLKRRFAVSIFSRDNPDYLEMVVAVKAIRKQGMEGYAEALAREISRLTSTTDFSVDQMREYLTDIEHYAAEIGAQLSFPEDLYNSALMGAR
ncbi:hypothetical protein KAR91_31755 [Candidatus Pacearchaeota archaeon]|nr:hypothetical protein [Candidatus Pacearchaeota archaeon]